MFAFSLQIYERYYESTIVLNSHAGTGLIVSVRRIRRIILKFIDIRWIDFIIWSSNLVKFFIFLL